MEDLRKTITGLLREAEGRKRQLPSGWYSPDGDCVFVYSEDVDAWADRVDEVFTLYRAMADNRVVGAQVKGISSFPKHDGMFLRIVEKGYVGAATLILFTLEKQRRERKRRLPRVVEEKYGEALSSLEARIPLREQDLVAR
jgi:hypothetical protein